MTIGEDRVRVKYNPSDSSLVGRIKRESAELIDLCAKQDQAEPEVRRLWALAQTHYENAAMWATKAATHNGG